MKIIDKANTTIEFSAIKIGQCFLYDNCLFVKMNPVKITDGSPNAFCFVDNAVACVPQACLVTPVEAEIIIRSKGAE